MSSPGRDSEADGVVRVHADPAAAAGAEASAADAVVATPAAAAAGGDVELAPIGESNNTTAVVAAAAAAPELPLTGRPALTIAFQDASIALEVPLNSRDIKTVVSPIVSLAKAAATLGKSNEKQTFMRANKLSGVIAPGSMVLVIAPPGHGKSTYLRALASRLQLTSGAVKYNGRTAEECAAEGVSVRKLCAVVDQTDEHLPLMTVHETLDFAHKCSAAVYDPARVEAVVRLIGLEECRDTILGNAMIRGVSGGQKRRVTLGEMLVSDACALFLDEYTNGLDTATAEDITRGLRKWTDDSQGIIVSTLQQPTPGLFALFDTIVVLNDAQVVYHGPREDVVPYFASMGFACPNDVDVCDFLIDCLSQPRVALDNLRATEKAEAKRRAASGAGAGAAPGALVSLDSSVGVLTAAATPCVTAAQMVAHYHASPYAQRQQQLLAAYFPAADAAPAAAFAPLLPSQEAVAMFGAGTGSSLLSLFALVLKRDSTLLSRSKDIIIPRLAQAILMGLMYGSLYYQIGVESFFLRVAVLLICLVQAGFMNMVSIFSVFAASKVVLKQTAAGFYPSAIAVVSALLSTVPLFALEAALLGLLIYFLSGCAYDAGAFFVFYAILFFQSVTLSAWFSMLASIAPDESAAQGMAGPSTGIFMLLGGFFVTLDGIPKFMHWLYYLSPFSWSVRAMAINEFRTPRYSEITDEGVRLGDLYLRMLSMETSVAWIGYCFLYLFAFTVVVMLLNTLTLHRPYYESSIGTRRAEDADLAENELDAPAADDEDDAAADPLALVPAAPAPAVVLPSGASNVSAAGAAAAAVGGGALVHSESGDSLVRTGTSFGGNPNALKTLREALPFTPTWLSFSKIQYTVQVPAKDGSGGKVDRVLLQRVDGYAEPGKLTALMGASGAGKTTLLDVLAGRKNTGVVEGKILLNGRVPSKADMAFATGYVEQFDSLFAYDTVRETLSFAAHLRLPSSVPAAVKDTIVDEVMDILELTAIQDFLIGNARIAGLSPSQLKRVNIGCELVANPSVLFLDEPTTGLDSKAAQTVMRVVRRIARSGRAVICTIHQPSAELFYLFDRLLLLASGGHQIYFGDLGARSRKFVAYLQSVPKVTPIPARYNPASWMLEELGVGQTNAASEFSDASASSGAGRFDSPAEITARMQQTFAGSAQRALLTRRLAQLEASAEEPAEAGASVADDAAAAAAPAEGEQQQHSEAEHASAGLGARRHSLSTSRLSAAGNASTTALPTAGAVLAKRESPALPVIFARVLRRAVVGHARNPPVVLVRYTILIVLSVLFGLIYLDLNVNTQANAVSLISVLAVGGSFYALISGATSLPIFLGNRAVMYRETASGLYHPLASLFAGFINEMLWTIASAFVATIPVYFMVGLADDAGRFFQYWLTLYVLSLCYISNSCFIAAVAPNAQIGGVLQGFLFGMFFAMNGVAMPWNALPAGYKWLFRMLPTSHAAEAFVMPQVSDCSPLPLCGPLIDVVRGTGTVQVHLPEFVADYLGFGFGGFGDQIGWMCLYIAVMLLLAALAITKLNFAQR